jgi:hypothetical protein
MIEKFNLNANQFKEQFPHHEASKPFNHFNNFEQYELNNKGNKVLPKS